MNSILRRSFYVVALLSPMLFYLAFFKLVTVPIALALVLLAAVGFFFILSFLRSRAIRASGILSLFLLLGVVGTVEMILKNMTEYLPREVVDVKPLTNPDQVNIVYKKHGFRGVRVPVGKVSEGIRILTMGGSSTYGIPMVSPALTYTAQFARLIEERRPSESFEVLNGGIAGFGIVQIMASLKEELLKYKPDVVTVCAWFNDSAPLPGWYGYAGMSDKEAYYLHRTLEKLDRSRIFSAIYRSRSFGLFRLLVLKAQGKVFALLSGGDQQKKKEPKEKKRRMSPEEFAWGLEEIVKLGREYNFLPVLILEPLSRTPALDEAKKRNKYYKQILEVAERHGLPVVNPLDRMAEFRDQWLFHDFIHPNSEGHRILAEELYDTLFVKEPAAALASFKIQHKVPEIPFASMESRYVFNSENEPPVEMRARLAAPFAKDEFPSVNLIVNGEVVGRADSVGPDALQYSVKLSGKNNTLPVNELRLRAVMPKRIEDGMLEIGSTGYQLPGSLFVVSGGKDYGWRVLVEVDNIKADLDGTGYNLVAIDRVTGDVVRNRFFDPNRPDRQENALLKEIEQLSHRYGDRVAIVLAVKGDGVGRANRETLRKAFNALGGSGAIPGKFESFVLVGVPGSTVGSAVERAGKELISMHIGRPPGSPAPLIYSSELQLFGKDGKLLEIMPK